jgi:methyl-accepting chemotaxis protein
MQWTISRKIGMGFVIPVVILLVIGAVAYRSMTKLVETSYQVAHTHQVLQELEAVLVTMVDAESGERGYVITGEERFLEPYQHALSRIHEEIKQIETLTADNPRQQRRLDALKPLVARRFDHLKAVIEIRRGQGLSGATEAILPGEGKKMIDDVRQVIAEMEDEENALIQQRSQLAEAVVRNTISTIVVGTLLSFVLVSVAGFFITRGVTSQVRYSVNVLASAASEILAATVQQAAGTSEEATAVQETTTTVDEVKQTVRVSAQQAKTVAETAQKTAKVAQDGQRAVEASITGMQEAKARMEALAERIIGLSEQGQAIGEIIATVNELGDQSNLLAVNAAIEAAKAGEAGKGFAVVAAEVKALAEQSKQATTQVRGILGEIQRATQAAVMATEQGVKAADAGEKVAQGAGESIRILAQSVHEAAQVAQQILVSAQQQVVGMDQIAMAIQNIQQVSTQNMVATQQVERAAQDLNALSQQLQALVAVTGYVSRSA